MQLAGRLWQMRPVSLRTVLLVYRVLLRVNLVMAAHAATGTAQLGQTHEMGRLDVDPVYGVGSVLLTGRTKTGFTRINRR